jgi:hypothetical protein
MAGASGDLLQEGDQWRPFNVVPQASERRWFAEYGLDRRIAGAGRMRSAKNRRGRSSAWAFDPLKGAFLELEKKARLFTIKLSDQPLG